MQRKTRSYRLVAPLMLASSVLVAAPATAQQPAAATPSVEGYLCAFAGKCDGAAPSTETRDAPATRGFRLARPGGDAEPSSAAAPAYRPRAAAVRPARTPRANAAPSYSAKAPLRAPAYGYAAPPTSVAAPGRPRADLLIGFELNSADLSAQGRSAAQVFARSLLLPELSAKRFVIEGHTDLRGGRAINNALSAKRAQAVVNYLVGQGVARDRLEARGFGSSVPLPGRRVTDPVNRRVEAELVS